MILHCLEKIIKEKILLLFVESFVFPIILFIPFIDLAERSARIADRNRIVRYIPCDNASRPDDRILSDRYA